MRIALIHALKHSIARYAATTGKPVLTTPDSAVRKPRRPFGA